MSLSQIHSFDYAILLCNKMEETRVERRVGDPALLAG